MLKTSVDNSSNWTPHFCLRGKCFWHNCFVDFLLFRNCVCFGRWFDLTRLIAAHGVPSLLSIAKCFWLFTFIGLIHTQSHSENTLIIQSLIGVDSIVDLCLSVQVNYWFWNHRTLSWDLLFVNCRCTFSAPYLAVEANKLHAINLLRTRN